MPQVNRPSAQSVLLDVCRVLTFRRPSSDIVQYWPVYLSVGLLFTLVAGVGRYWDNEKAAIWQSMGLGSLAYVFVLSLFLWTIVLPLKPQLWSFRNVLVFVTLTSPPAFLYAIPVEKFSSIGVAQNLNLLFLAAVAIWRVGLLVWFLRSVAALSGGRIFVATTLPIALIIVALSFLNLEHVVFELMAGNRQPSEHDTAYFVVVLLSVLCSFALPFLLLAYLIMVFGDRKTV